MASLRSPVDCQVSVLIRQWKVKELPQRQCERSRFHRSSHFRNTIVMPLPAKMPTPGQSPISRLQELVIGLSWLFTIAPSLHPVYLPAAADALTHLRIAAVLASVSWRQWQGMQVITTHSQTLLLCLKSFEADFEVRSCRLILPPPPPP